MKTLFLLLSIALCGAVQAQTNAVKGAAAKSPPAPTEINSDTADFDLSASARQAVYRGHVVVVDPQMKLKCEQLVVYLPPSGERVNHRCLPPSASVKAIFSLPPTSVSR